MNCNTTCLTYKGNAKAFLFILINESSGGLGGNVKGATEEAQLFYTKLAIKEILGLQLLIHLEILVFCHWLEACS